ncbi:MAG: CBS domain-containing protein [Bdellovibrionales bacterium]|nr:CBS domain-containing protein [Bdellovibrionales bacterium]
MHLSEWSERLKFIQIGIEGKSVGKRISPLLDRSISEVFPRNLVVLTPTQRATEALSHLEDEGVDFALIQDSPDTILGVLDRESISSFVEASTRPVGDLVVASLMSRNVCIEPDSATLREVMERMTLGSCPCTVIVDRIGQPVFIVSPKAIIEFFETAEAGGGSPQVYARVAAVG